MSAAKTFAAIAEAPRPRKKGCPRCGAEGLAGTVSVKVTELKGGRGASRQVAGKSVRLCEPCAVEVYHSTVAVLAEDAKVGE